MSLLYRIVATHCQNLRGYTNLLQLLETNVCNTAVSDESFMEEQVFKIRKLEVLNIY